MSKNFSLSFELIYLMAWILKNEKAKLHGLIEEIVKKGFATEISQMVNYPQDPKTVEKLHLTILDFLIFMEDSLLESLDKKDFNLKIQVGLKPTLEKINTQNIDAKTIWRSTQQTKSLINKDENKTPEDLKKILLNQLLQNWNPKDKEPLN